MTGNQKAQYTGLAMCRNTEVTMRWTRSTFFLLGHSAAFSVLATRLEHLTFGLLFSASLLGMFFGAAWMGTIWRTNQRVAYWQSRLRAFEETEVDADPAGVPLFSGAD